MAKTCTVYIDEAGDLGANRGTQWFVLTGVVVNEEDEPIIRNVVKNIRNKLNIQTIHWRTINDFNRKIYIMREMEALPFEYINVLFDTNQYDKKKIPSYDVAYNFMCKYLLERASWLLESTNRTGKIVLSSRGTARDKELESYINDKLLPYSFNSINNVFSNAISKPASQWDMLQLADICATTTFNTYETHWLGFTTPCFSSMIRSKLYRKNGKCMSYGIKYFAENMKPSKDYFAQRSICGYIKAKNKGETLGATTT